MNVIELLQQPTQSSQGGILKVVQAQQCWRCMNAMAREGHTVCGDCLEWMRGEDIDREIKLIQQAKALVLNHDQACAFILTDPAYVDRLMMVDGDLGQPGWETGPYTACSLS